jgi:hypothetical protein
MSRDASPSGDTTDPEDSDDDMEGQQSSGLMSKNKNTLSERRVEPSLESSSSQPLSKQSDHAVDESTQSRGKQPEAISGSDYSPVGPTAKRQKTAPSSEEDLDSEDERKQRVARLKSGGSAKRGGARQPIKRGGRKF